MTEHDPHAPTTAGPEPEPAPVTVTEVTPPVADVPAPTAAQAHPAAEPEPDVAQATSAAGPAPEPTPVVGAADATWGRPAGSALLDGPPAAAPVDPHPEKLVGAAFGGGLVLALLLKGMAKRRHA
ncbi:hypothetical protein [Baekduia soli]|uniref:hypothetical protein n=1 Tax=Baekduia soli TaxID=496014 RepID=UPI001651F608|nr:hypothetical protein [Baekduia soli]